MLAVLSENSIFQVDVFSRTVFFFLLESCYYFVSGSRKPGCLFAVEQS